MTVKTYKNTSDNRAINKQKTDISTVTARLLDNTSILSPSLVLSYNDNLLTCNYIYVQEFDRYYFVNDIVILDNGRVRFDCNVDVLESFKTDILNLTCIASRNSKKYNLYLDDSKIKSYNKTQVQTKIIDGSAFNPHNLSANSYCFVLQVAG